MYKTYTKPKGKVPRLYRKIRLIMRLITMILLTSLMQVSAASMAQRVSLSKTNAKLEDVIDQLRKLSGYNFITNSDLLDQSKLVTINVKNAEMDDVLQLIFKDQSISYTLRDKTVILKAKKESFLDHVVARFQAIDVRGRITDKQSMPLVGATVTVKSTNRSTTSDAEGNFFLPDVEPKSVLVISYIGYLTQEVTAVERLQDIQLEVASSQLQEVVINTGFQLVRKERMTGATVSVGSEDLEKRYTPNILDNLEGRAPGLVIYRGASTIRGIGTINANKNPLIVLDGLPIEGGVADINPYDVENITVLKDAAAAAIYGARAANGVIVITTKRAKSGRTDVEFFSDFTLSEKPDLEFNLLTPAQQVDVEGKVYEFLFANTGGAYPNTAAAVAGTDAAIIRGSAMQPVYRAYYELAKGSISRSEFDERIASLKTGNFRQQFKDHALLNGLLQQYNLAVRNSGQKFQSNLVLNYKTNNTGMINAYDRQINLFYKGTYDVAPWLSANYGVNTVLGYGKSSNSAFATSALNMPAYESLLDASGNRNYYTTADYNMYNTDAASQPLYNLQVNHLEELERDMKRSKSQNTRYFLNLVVRPMPGLTLTPQFQYENQLLRTDAYSESESYIMRYLKSVYTTLLPSGGGKLATVNKRGDFWTARGQAQYQRSFGKHALDVIGGVEFRQTRVSGTGGLLLGYDDQLQSHATQSVSYPALYALRNTTAFKPGFSTAALYNTYLSDPLAVIPETVHRFNSNYANATYTYDNRYNAFGSFRIDYADVFGLDEKFRGRPLWSAGLGWNVHNEGFMADLTWLNFLKMRATYGVTGNIVQGVSSFLTANSTLVNPITNMPLSVVTNAANPELRWEKTATVNLGVDFAVLDNRLTGTLDLYRKKGSDLLVTTRLDPSEGFTSQIINNGGILNKGVEFSIDYQWFNPDRKDGFRWMTSVLMSHNRNRITYIDEVATTPVALVQNGYRVGFPVNSLYSFQYRGLDDIGQPQWLTANGALSNLALTANDMDAILYTGTTDPKVNATLTNELNYKGFSLNVLAVYYGGHSLRALAPDVFTGVPYGAMPAYLAEAWEPGNTTTIIPGYGRYAPGMYAGTRSAPPYHLAYSDAFVRKGDFLKIRSVTLGYQLPQEWIRRISARSVGFRFQMNNPKALWLRNDVGVDPETGAARIPSSFVFGINVNY